VVAHVRLTESRITMESLLAKPRSIGILPVFLYLNGTTNYSLKSTQKVLEDDNQPIRSVCHLVKHNTDQLITILDKYNKGCIRDDDFDDRAENSLSRISNRILKKLNC